MVRWKLLLLDMLPRVPSYPGKKRPAKRKHKTLVPELDEELKKQGAGDIVVIAGGVKKTAFAAVTSIGAVAVCMNAWWTPDEMAYGLEDSGSKVVIGDAERVERAATSLERLGVRALSVRAESVPAGVDRLEDLRRPGAYGLPGAEDREPEVIPAS